jgi:hypothetical protein
VNPLPKAISADRNPSGDRRFVCVVRATRTGVGLDPDPVERAPSCNLNRREGALEEAVTRCNDGCGATTAHRHGLSVSRRGSTIGAALRRETRT